MRYTLTIAGEAAHPALVQKIADVLALALGGAPQIDLAFAADPPPRSTGRVDFATEPVAVTIDLTDAGAAISVSARDGEVVAAGETVDAAMSSIGVLPAALPVDSTPVIADSKEAT